MPDEGYLLLMDEPGRAAKLRERAEEGESFSDAVSSADGTVVQKAVWLIGFNRQEIHGAAIGERSPRRAADYKHKIEFDAYHACRPVSLDGLTASLPRAQRAHFERVVRGPDRSIPPATWRAVVAELHRREPAFGDALAELEAEARRVSPRPDGDAWAVVGQERDAAGLLLDIAMMDRKVVFRGFRPAPSPIPFLAGIDRAYRIEAGAIHHDTKVFEDWRLVDHLNCAVSGAEFTDGKSRLAILNLNTCSLETTFGADLLYYHQGHRSFVMVQYKRMRRLKGEDFGGAVYYPNSDRHYEPELKRMRSWDRWIRQIAPEVSARDLRLTTCPFFFKLCEPEATRLRSPSLTPGMYFSIRHWRSLLKTPEVQGARGGIAVSHDTAGQWFNNTMFTGLVQGGWIGSRPGAAKYISRMIRRQLLAQRSVTIGIHTTT